MKNIILDTDMGPDDAWALIILLKAEQFRDYRVRGITCVHGNTDTGNAAKNTLRVLEVINRTEVPVYKGCFDPLISKRNVPNPFFGIDGFGDTKYETHPDMTLLKEEHGVNAIYRIAKEYKKITMMCIGPLTNLAMAVKMYPDIVDSIEEIYIMGGNHLGVGNITQCAEYNFYEDPEAVSVVLDTFTCPIVISPWEPCLKEHIDMSIDWRFNMLGAIDSPIIKLLNPAEKVFLTDVDNWRPVDVHLVAAFLKPKETVRKAAKRFVSIELNGSLTRGQMIVDHLKEKAHNALVIELVNGDILKNLFLWAAGHPIDFE